MARTIEEIDADIAAMNTALTKLVTGTRVQSVKHGDRETSWASANAGDADTSIRRRLRELQCERARVSGAPSPVAPHNPFSALDMG